MQESLERLRQRKGSKNEITKIEKKSNNDVGQEQSQSQRDV